MPVSMWQPALASALVLLPLILRHVRERLGTDSGLAGVDQHVRQSV
jgi:hypothetical protein